MSPYNCWKLLQIDCCKNDIYTCSGLFVLQLYFVVYAKVYFVKKILFYQVKSRKQLVIITSTRINSLHQLPSKCLGRIHWEMLESKLFRRPDDYLVGQLTCAVLSGRRYEDLYKQGKAPQEEPFPLEMMPRKGTQKVSFHLPHDLSAFVFNDSFATFWYLCVF